MKYLILVCSLLYYLPGSGQSNYNARSVFLSGTDGVQLKDTSNYCGSNPCPLGTIIYGSNGTDSTIFVRGKKKWKSLAISGSSGVNTASPPLFVSGHNMTIQVATTSQNGYLTNTDWNTFNNKVGTASSPLIKSGVDVSIQVSNTSQGGYLTNTDWNTFNNKIGGSLTTGRIPFASGSNTLIDDGYLSWDNSGKILQVGRGTTNGDLGSFNVVGRNAGVNTSLSFLSNTTSGGQINLMTSLNLPLLINSSAGNNINITPGGSLILTGGTTINSAGSTLTISSQTQTNTITSTATITIPQDISYIVNSVTGVIPLMLSGSATLDFPVTPGGNFSDLTMTLTGAVDGDQITLGVPNAVVTTQSLFYAWVSSSNTVTVRYFNLFGLSGNPPSSVFKCSILR